MKSDPRNHLPEWTRERSANFLFFHFPTEKPDIPTGKRLFHQNRRRTDVSGY